MNIKRILQDPALSIQKQIRKVKAIKFVKDYSQKIFEAQKSTNADINLDALFLDSRSSVEGKINKIKHIAVKILRMIDHLSKAHDFNYMLAYGSLLGALRHDGFIPWDDDLDIMMTKSDVQKLIAVSHNFPATIKFYPVSLNFLKVMDRHSIITPDGKRGVAIDIFVLDDETDGYSFVNVHSQRRIYLESKDILPIKQHQFEDQIFSIPNNSDKILTNIYGDYMTPPPPHLQVPSHTDESSIHIYDYPNQ